MNHNTVKKYADNRYAKPPCQGLVLVSGYWRTSEYIEAERKGKKALEAGDG